ncbi:MAG: LuxR C-terminal-related transcriptional regulator [Verrucomicrobiota bacterium]
MTKKFGTSPTENMSGEISIPAKLAKAGKRFKLTPRQLTVLTLVFRGEPQKAIADAMSITERGVRFHVARIFQRLGVESCTAAAGRIFIE